MAHLRLNIYVGVLVASAVACGLAILPASPILQPGPVAVLFVLTVILSNMAVELPFAVSMSLIFATICAGILYAGPVGGALMGLAGGVSIQEIREHKAVVLMVGNLAQLSLAGLIAGWVFTLLGGVPMQSASTIAPNLMEGLVAPAAAVVTFYVLNLCMVGVAVALRTGMGWRATLEVMSPVSYLFSLLVLALLGYVMAHLIAASSWFGLLLLVLPFAMARQTFRVYVELAEAYTETVRSLVAAIEAKDRYTRGHSERVAVHARRLAAKLGLPAADVDLAERAALLHDVGKIGIAQATLTSPSKLSAPEVRQIRRHPVIGAELAEDVAFLSDIVPIVRHHHERIDGAGYPDGLAGPDIPLLARVLAVVDSYDAMTSDRAYRPAMGQEAAVDELKRVAGTQLDSDVVAEFAVVLEERVEEASLS
jgi:putative nucleotidyltransferase with HDIG domain